MFLLDRVVQILLTALNSLGEPEAVLLLNIQNASKTACDHSKGGSTRQKVMTVAIKSTTATAIILEMAKGSRMASTLTSYATLCDYDTGIVSGLHNVPETNIIKYKQGRHLPTALIQSNAAMIVKTVLRVDPWCCPPLQSGA